MNPYVTMTLQQTPYDSTALLAQTDSGPFDRILELFPFVIAFCVIAIPCGLAYLVYRYQVSTRQLLHAERLAAIEAGADPNIGVAEASEGYRNQAFWIAFWLVVCGCGVSFGTVAQNIEPDTDVRIATVGWAAAGLSSTVASIVAGLVIFKAKPREKEATTPSRSSSVSKTVN